MTKTSYLILAGLLLFLFTGRVAAQSKSALEDEAYEYLNNNEFVKAYDAFDKLNARYPKEIDYQFKLGICALSYPEKKARAIEIFQDMAMRYKTREAEFYLGKAFHVNYKFEQALNVLEPLVASISSSKKKEDKAMVEDAKLIINNCKNGITLTRNKTIAQVKNIGSPINTREIEGVPVITGDESMMIFTYQGKKSMGGKVNASLQPDPNGVYTSDIYMTTRNADSTWKPAVPITALNTKGNDAAIAISPDGLTLFTFLSNSEIAGDIYVSKLNGTEFSKPVPLNDNINTQDYWEGSCSISADGKLLYFSSERPTGLGGKDIWVSEKVDGDWGPAVNLGPQINTPYDDDAPFIHPDGVTLFFSSKGHVSIGGYDIMFSIKQPNGEWAEPKSMGIPLNTTEDDSYYVINSKGDMGYFSSDRATADAKGGQDIYTVNPGILGERPIVALFKGTVLGDGKPVEAKLEVFREGKDEVLGPYMTNPSTGKYLLTLKPGYVYRIKINADGYEPYEEEINLETMTDYIETQKDFKIFSKPFMASNPDAKAGSTTKELVRASPKPKELPPPTDSTGVAKTATPVTSTETASTPDKTTVAKETSKEHLTESQMSIATQQELAKESERLENEEKTRRAVARFQEEQRKKTEAKQAKLEEKIARAEEKRKKKEQARQEAIAATEMPVETASPCNSKLPELGPLKGRSLNDPEVYRMLMDLAGSYCAQGLVFKVQVGAYRNPSNFNASKLKHLGKIESEMYPDGITRFTQNQYTNLKDAEAHRQKAIAKGQGDSWIVAFVNGKRYTLEDFIMADFLGKTMN